MRFYNLLHMFLLVDNVCSATGDFVSLFFLHSVNTYFTQVQIFQGQMLQGCERNAFHFF